MNRFSFALDDLFLKHFRNLFFFIFQIMNESIFKAQSRNNRLSLSRVNEWKNI